MGVIDWVGSKVAKYGFGLKGVTTNDVKIIRKYFPVTEMHKLSEMTEQDAYKLYHKAKANDLERLAEIVESNKEQIMKQFKSSDVQLSMTDMDNIIMSLRRIIKAKRERKSKKEMEKIIDKMLKTFQKTNPEWFIEENFREDTVLRF